MKAQIYDDSEHRMWLKKGALKRPWGDTLQSVYMFPRAVPSFKIHFNLIFLGIYILGVFRNLPIIPCKVTSAKTAKHIQMRPILITSFGTSAFICALWECFQCIPTPVSQRSLLSCNIFWKAASSEAWRSSLILGNPEELNEVAL